MSKQCEEKKAVTAEEAQKWARERGIQCVQGCDLLLLPCHTCAHTPCHFLRFFEVSANSGHNVKESLAALFDLAMDTVLLGASGSTGDGASKGAK